jgi:hypothetical protein
MTDLDKFLELIKGFGLEFNKYEFEISGVKTTTIEFSTDMNKVNGYTGFSTDFLFDNEGKFLELGIYE